MPDPALPELSLVVPMYNEEAAIGRFFERVRPVLDACGCRYEIVCVNDGSRDGTLDRLVAEARSDRRIRVLDLSRNFGKEAALTAGIDHARGAAVIPIDADLQEPPELIPDMIALWREGYDVVLAERKDRSSDSVGKRVTARWFYRVMNWLSDVNLPENVGDFRLMDRRVVDALGRLPERSRFMKGVFAWLGFRQARVGFTRPARLDGAGKQSPRALMRLALDGFVSFSSAPLRIWTYIGLLTSFGALAFMLYIVAKTLFFGADTPGFATIMTVLLFFNGLLMINLGIIGEYLARIFVEVKARPIYILREEIHFADGEPQ